MKLFEWLAEKENVFFVAHIAAVFVLALVAEAYAPGLTSVTFPAVILLAAASFMYNYPIAAIKQHGLFSEYLIDLRLLWLVLLGLIFEYIIFRWFEHGVNFFMAVGAVVIGLFLIFFARNKMQGELVKARGFK